MGSSHLMQIGLGSSFHKVSSENIKTFAISDYLKNYQLFYTGRHAIRHLIDHIKVTKKVATIWLPAYYCQHVTSWLREVYSRKIQTYSIYPFDGSTNFTDFSFAQPNDIVILNNFWGLYTYSYPTKKNRPIFIEDHSHGWLSPSCLENTADYCFASLRKTLPVALGGIIWSNSLPLPSKATDTREQKDFMLAWDAISKAMSMKTDLLEGYNIINKKDYLALIYRFESFLHKQHNIVALYEAHQKEIELFLNKDYGFYKKENLLYSQLKIKKNALFSLVKVPIGFSFGLCLIFKDRDALNTIKLHLVKNHIYPSELWPDNMLNFDEKYLLNIHIDFRYNFEDMDYITTTLNNFLITN